MSVRESNLRCSRCGEVGGIHSPICRVLAAQQEAQQKAQRLAQSEDEPRRLRVVNR